MDISPTALVNASTQMQQSQVAKTAQFVVLQKGRRHRATEVLALLQALPLVTIGTWALRSSRWHSPLTGWQRLRSLGFWPQMTAESLIPAMRGAP